MRYEKLTHAIIGCAMELHNTLGNGFQEVIYQRALAHELKLKSISFEREFEMPVSYKGLRIGTRRVDFLVHERISVEIKAVINLEEVHLPQAMNYLEIRLLINFGARSLDFKRLHNNNLNRDE